jgi:hypothetical protein
MATRTATETIRPFQELVAIHEAAMTSLQSKQAAMRARAARYADRSKRDRAVLAALRRGGLQSARAEARRWSRKAKV